MKCSFKKLSVLFFLVFVMFQLTGCRTAPGARFTALAPIDTEKGDVYLYRTKAFVAMGQDFDVKVQDLPAGRLYNESYLHFRLNPGPYKLTVTPGPFGVRSHLNIEVKAGERSFYQFDFPTGLLANTFFIGSSIQPRTPDVAEADLKDLIAAQTDNGEKSSKYRATKFAELKDLNTAPLLPSKVREAYKLWLTRVLPRAFVIASDGSAFPTWGMTPEDRTEAVDPVARALQRCHKTKDVECRVYAVDNRVVWVVDADARKEAASAKMTDSKDAVAATAPPKVAAITKEDKPVVTAAPQKSEVFTPPENIVVVPEAKEAKDAAITLPQDFPVKAVTPIYSQLLYMGLPKDFRTVSENTSAQRYIREAVLVGESLSVWSEMLTVSGVKDTASEVTISPANYAEHIANGFRQVCPTSFSQKKMSEGIVNGYEQYVMVVSCGQSAATAGRTSESALVIVIKGERDYYTVQWAERSMPSAMPLPINMAKWVGRYQQLAPVRLCARVPGEKEPYPSCLNPG